MIQDTDMNADFHNGPNLGLEPTPPRQVTYQNGWPVPAGWKLVPEEPSRAMLRPFWKWPPSNLTQAYRAALAVAPEPPAAPQDEPSDEEIDAIAASMPDGAGGMLKQWGYRQFARALLARYGNAAAQTADDARDAARYRWLRKGANDDIAVVRGLGAMDYGMSAVAYTYSEEIDGDDLDAAIDRAMKEQA